MLDMGLEMQLRKVSVAGLCLFVSFLPSTPQDREYLSVSLLHFLYNVAQGATCFLACFFIGSTFEGVCFPRCTCSFPLVNVPSTSFSSAFSALSSLICFLRLICHLHLHRSRMHHVLFLLFSASYMTLFSPRINFTSRSWRHWLLRHAIDDPVFSTFELHLTPHCFFICPSSLCPMHYRR